MLSTLLFTLTIFRSIASSNLLKHNQEHFPKNLMTIGEEIIKETECHDPTEPFRCVGSSICISLQFLCDSHSHDCPNNTDEDEAMCIASIIYLHKFKFYILISFIF